MEKEAQRFVVKYLWVQSEGSKEIHEKLIIVECNDACGLSHIIVWRQKFRKRDLFDKDLPRPGQPPLTLGRQLETLLQNHSFASAEVITNHFHTIKHVLQRELSLKNSRGVGCSIFQLPVKNSSY
jgi:hypothetical protein